MYRVVVEEFLGECGYCELGCGIFGVGVEWEREVDMVESVVELWREGMWRGSRWCGKGRGFESGWRGS